MDGRSLSDGDAHNHRAIALLDVDRLQQYAFLDWGRGGTGAESPEALRDGRLREALVEALAANASLERTVRKVGEAAKKIAEQADDVLTEILDAVDEADPGDYGTAIKREVDRIRVHAGADKSPNAGLAELAYNILHLLEHAVSYHQDGMRRLREELESQRAAAPAATAAAKTSPLQNVPAEAAVAPHQEPKKRGRPRLRPPVGSTTEPLPFDRAAAAPHPPDTFALPGFCSHCPTAYAGNDGICDRHGLRVPECWDGDRLRKRTTWITGDRAFYTPKIAAAPPAPQKRGRDRPRKTAKSEEKPQ